jgi:hypothetical protein
MGNHLLLLVRLCCGCESKSEKLRNILLVTKGKARIVYSEYLIQTGPGKADVCQLPAINTVVAGPQALSHPQT